MMRSTIQSWNEIYHGLMPVEIDGWVLTLFNDCDTLDYCGGLQNARLSRRDC
ncbi:DUF7693 family protein [Pseudomonas sp. ILQ215 TE3946]|uniref:DUF7693 family protein n=2 Tax=Pseudomonas TaxID=286 RepID=UPI003D219200